MDKGQEKKRNRRGLFEEMGKQQMKFMLDAVIFFLLFINIICLGHLIAEHQKITICQSCQEQNWTGELPAVDMKVNCSEVKDWCKEEVMVEKDESYWWYHYQS